MLRTHDRKSQTNGGARAPAGAAEDGEEKAGPSVKKV